MRETGIKDVTPAALQPDLTPAGNPGTVVSCPPLSSTPGPKVRSMRNLAVFCVLLTAFATQAQAAEVPKPRVDKAGRFAEGLAPVDLAGQVGWSDARGRLPSRRASPSRWASPRAWPPRPRARAGASWMPPGGGPCRRASTGSGPCSRAWRLRSRAAAGASSTRPGPGRRRDLRGGRRLHRRPGAGPAGQEERLRQPGRRLGNPRDLRAGLALRRRPGDGAPGRQGRLDQSRRTGQSPPPSTAAGPSPRAWRRPGRATRSASSTS